MCGTRVSSYGRKSTPSFMKTGQMVQPLKPQYHNHWNHNITGRMVILRSTTFLIVREVCKNILNNKNMLHTYLRHFITSLPTSYINNDIWIGIFWQWLGNNSLATSKGSGNGSGTTLHTPTTIKPQKKVKIQQEIWWIQTQSGKFKCNVN